MRASDVSEEGRVGDLTDDELPHPALFYGSVVALSSVIHTQSGMSLWMEQPHPTPRRCANPYNCCGKPELLRKNLYFSKFSLFGDKFNFEGSNKTHNLA